MTSWRKKLARWRRSLASGDRNARAARELIRTSGLFDPVWYLERYPDVAAAGLDPLEHFYSHGGVEGRKASPEFDSRWYVLHNPDAAASGLHPLVHFLKHGQGRETTKRVGSKGVKTGPGDLEAAAEIMASPLFDAVWYARENYLDTAGHGTALHYLKVGGVGGLPASPGFDSAAYLRTYSDVREAGDNPLLHYIRHGAREGRKIFAVSLRSAEVVQPFVARDLRRISRPEPDEVSQWARSGDLKAKRGRALVLLGGVPAGLLTEVYEDNTAPLPDGLRMAIADFCALRGVVPASFTTARSGRKTLHIPDIHQDAGPDQPTLLDGWFVNDGVLRLRLESGASDGVVRLIQAACNGEATLIGEAYLGRNGMHVVDATVMNAFQPVLVVNVDVRGFITGGRLIPFPSLFRGGAHAAETAASVNGATLEEKRDALSRTLLRDALGWKGAPALSIGKVVLDLKGATGMERIFSVDALQWLSECGVIVEAGKVAFGTPQAVADHLGSALQARPVKPETRRTGRATLSLPCDALPALGALMSRRSAGASRSIGAYLMCDSTLPIPRWMVTMPDLDQGLLDLQPATAPLPFPVLSDDRNRSPGVSSRTGVLAIRYRDTSASNEALLAFPVAPDAAGGVLEKPLSSRRRAGAAITAIIMIDDPLLGAGLLESLARQTLADRLNITVATPGDSRVADAVQTTLERLFPARHEMIVIDAGSPAAIINAAVSHAMPVIDMLLFARQDMTLHDPRTLETLYLMASRPGTATASCVTVRNGGFRDGAAIQFKSGGIFPSRLSFSTSPALVFSRPETLGAFPMATYPVAGNSLDLAMVTVEAWRASEGLAAANHPFDGYALDFALRTLRAGMTHLCTSVVTVTDGGEAVIDHRGDLLSVDTLEIGEWAQALDRVAFLRALD